MSLDDSFVVMISLLSLKNLLINKIKKKKKLKLIWIFQIWSFQNSKTDLYFH